MVEWFFNTGFTGTGDKVGLTSIGMSTCIYKHSDSSLRVFPLSDQKEVLAQKSFL